MTHAFSSKYASSDVDCALLDGLDLEMEANEGEHQALQVLQCKLLRVILGKTLQKGVS